MLFLERILESRNKWHSKALYASSNIVTRDHHVSQYCCNFCIVIAARRESDLEKQCLTTKKIELICQKKLKHVYMHVKYFRNFKQFEYANPMA